MPVARKQRPPKAKQPKKKGVLSRIKPIGVNKPEGIKLSLYGRSGTGKTTFWATFPKPILAIICSGGNKPGELRSIGTPEYAKVIHQVVPDQVGEISEIADYCEANPDEYATIVLDHATGMQDQIIKEMLGLDEAPVQLSWGLMSQQQYGQMGIQSKQLLRRLLSLPQNVVIVAQEREFNTDNESDLLMPYVSSSLTPSVTGWLNPAVDYICQTLVQQKHRVKKLTVGGQEVKSKVPMPGVNYCLRTGPDAVYTTKFRVPKGHNLPDIITDPDYNKFMKIIRG